MSEHSPRRPHSHLYLALSVNYAAMISLAIAVNLIPVFLTTLRVDFGDLSNEQLGRVGGVTFVGLVIGILVTGPLADRFGAKVFAVFGNALVGVGLGILGFCPNYDVLLLGVLLMGLGAGMLDMVLSPIVAALQPDNRTSAMNWLHSFYCVGAVLAVLAGAIALRFGISWRVLSLGMIAMPLVVMIGFLVLRMPPLVPANSERTRLGQLIKEPFFQLSLVAIFFAGATELGMAQWLPAYAETTLGYSKWTAGISLVAFSLAMALGRMSVGAIGTRVSGISMLLISCAGCAITFVIACFAPWPAIALAGCVAAGFVGSALWPSMLAVTADRFPHGGATMFGLLAALGNAGGIFMPWGVGAVADHSSLKLGLATSILCPVLMIVCLLLIRRHAPTLHVASASAATALPEANPL